jgi:hypothetical protein
MHGAVRGRQLTDRRKQGIMAATATINGTELAYIEHGQGPPVVFVHGGVGDYREGISRCRRSQSASGPSP